MIAVADAFDSMTTTRSYRGARTVTEAMTELRRCAGDQFDPRMVEALVTAVDEHGWSPDEARRSTPRRRTSRSTRTSAPSTTTTRPARCCADRSA